MHALLPYGVGISAYPTPQTSKPDIRRYRTPNGGPQAVLGGDALNRFGDSGDRAVERHSSPIEKAFDMDESSGSERARLLLPFKIEDWVL